MTSMNNTFRIRSKFYGGNCGTTPWRTYVYSYISCGQPSQISTIFMTLFHSVSHCCEHVRVLTKIRTKSSRESCIFSPTKYIPMRSCEILFSHEIGDCCFSNGFICRPRTPFSHILIINVVVWNSILVFRVLRGTHVSSGNFRVLCYTLLRNNACKKSESLSTPSKVFKKCFYVSRLYGIIKK